MSDPQSQQFRSRGGVHQAGRGGLLAGGAGSVSHAQEASSSKETAVTARKGQWLVTQSTGNGYRDRGQGMAVAPRSPPRAITRVVLVRTARCWAATP